MGLSFDVKSGLLMRQAHHWAADIFLGSIAVHMARVFFTGAFRKPREFNWIVGTIMLILGIVNGFLGYSLPDDLVSGTGIRIAFSIIESIPVVGSYLGFFLFGGNYPGSGIILERFFLLHILIVPALIVGLLAAHLGLLVKQKHTQFPGKGKTEHNVVGSPMFPTFMAKTTGFLFMTAGGHLPAGRLRPDQPHLAVRAVRAVPDLLRRPAGLVHGVAGRGAPDHAQLGVGGLGPHPAPRGLPPGGHLPGADLQHPHHLAVHRVDEDQGPRLPQPARPAPGPPASGPWPGP